ncbi:MAG: hypothetical protein HOP33_06155 [Verrucomicrobia bacterium]|nr:hypothetical protein [Verrucomicrobiota bacterium]
MKTITCAKLRATSALLLLSSTFAAFAFQHPDHESIPDIDVRRSNVARTNALSAAREAGVQRLKSHIADLRVGLDERQHRPNFVSRRNGFLTGSDSGGTVISRATLNSVFSTDPHRVTKAFLNEHPGVFGHDASALTNAVIKRDSISKHNGLRSTVWEQQLNGIPIFEAIVQSHVTKNGELVSLASRFVPDPAKAAGPRKPKLTAAQAEAGAAQSLGETNLIAANAATKLIWLPMDAATMRLCWDVMLTVSSCGEMFRLLVDAQTGEVLVRRCLTTYLSNASYRVFTSDSPSPFSPGWSSLITNQPPLASRSLVTIDALSTNASPGGWLPDGNTETLGNNVDAHTDRNADNIQDTPRPQCTIDRVFDFPLDLATHPTNSSAASVVQLFYWCNWMHDQLYELGFDEAAGNFQSDNYGRGGVGGDALQADGQDGSGFNNANMTTPPDGSTPRMQMYLWNGTTPNRDGDLDAEMVLHEYTHGLSWRLVGGGVGISALQTSGMGEGWSDFYALALLGEAGDDPNGCYALGGYVAHLFGGQPESYYFGVRRYPYSTDMKKNPLTFGHISQAVYDGSIPRNPTMTSTQQQSPAEVHNLGEVWCSALWEVRASLIARHGFASGNQLALQLVTDGMKLSPAEPNFLQARDAIIQADLVNNTGTNHNELWAAFARRGMGFSATCPDSSTTANAVEAFDNGDDLQATPDTAFITSGGKGGAFSPSCQTYTLTNAGVASLSWAAVHTQPWLDVSPASGVLATGETVTVSVCLNASANALNAGGYTGTLAFSNTLTGAIQARGVVLDVLPTQRAFYFPLDTDPGWTHSGTWTFGHPNGLGGDGGFSYGFADPTNGATGSNVYGVNLNGNYATTLGAAFNLTSGALNLTGKSNCVVQFQRWLNSDDSLFVQAEFYVSTNGTAYTRIWANGLATTDSAWSKQHYNISALADNQPTVHLRWTYRIIKTGARAMSGWNIDDVEILADAAPVIVAPLLDIQLTPPDTALLSWPTNAAGFVLQQNSDLSTTNWLDATNTASVVGTNSQVIISPLNGTEFFRLVHP